MNKHLLLIFFVLTALCAQSQIPDYYVYSYIGDISCMRKGQLPQKIQSKYLLYSTDTLSSPKGKLTLVDRDDNFYEIEIKNFLQLKSLSKPTNKNKPITRKYLHFLWEEFFHKSSNSNDFIKSKLNSIAGEIKSVSQKQCNIERFPPKDLVSDYSKINFEWTAFTDKAEYKFSILDRYGKEVYNTTTRDTTLSLDNTVFLKTGIQDYYWNVAATTESKSCPNAPWEFQVLQKQSTTENGSDEISGTMNNPLFTSLKKIEKWDESKFYLKAIDEYENLIKKYPGDHYLIISYAEYLKNIGLKTKALNIINRELK